VTSLTSRADTQIIITKLIKSSQVKSSQAAFNEHMTITQVLQQ